MKTLHTVVAVVGIGALSAGGWWWQNRPAPAPAVSAGAAPAAAAGAGARGPGAAPGGPAGAAAPGGPPRPAGVEVAPVQVVALRDDAQTVGTLRSRQGVMLRPEVAGRVVTIGFADGQPVRRGQLLVALDDQLPQAEVRQAAAQLAIAQANHRRNQELVSQNFVAQRVLEESAASLQVAQAQLALACARLARMRIHAPFDGVAGIRQVNVGDYVKDGAELVNVEDISTLLVDFRLPERYQTRARRGQEVELQIDAVPGRRFTARIDAIDPQIDANGRSIAVRAVLSNPPGEGASLRAAASAAGSRPAGAAPAAGLQPAPGMAAVASGAAAPDGSDGSPCPPAAHAVSGTTAGSGPAVAGPLRPGMFARVTAVFSVNERALVVPEEALVPQAGRQFVFKAVPRSQWPGTVTAGLPEEVTALSRRAEVRLGVRRPGQVEIVDGLAEGDVVVVAGQQRLQRDGTPLRIVEVARGAPAAGGGGPRGPGSPGGAGGAGGAGGPPGGSGGPGPRPAGG